MKIKSKKFIPAIAKRSPNRHKRIIETPKCLIVETKARAIACLKFTFSGQNTKKEHV
ncbi:MAG: hypothetical protein ACK4M9_06280 [Anaerobacillus sp.]